MAVTGGGDAVLIRDIRRGDEGAWQRLIDRYEQRLLMFAQRRLNDRQRAEDVVQDTFIGFYNSLPNYDDKRELQSYLFTIAAHKVTDQIRKITREQQRYTGEGGDELFPHLHDDRQRSASSAARSAERHDLEHKALTVALGGLLRQYRQNNDFQRIKVLELLFVSGKPNFEVAKILNLGDQQVANLRFAAVKKIKDQIRNAGLCVDVFPELNDDGGG